MHSILPTRLKVIQVGEEQKNPNTEQSSFQSSFPPAGFHLPEQQQVILQMSIHVVLDPQLALCVLKQGAMQRCLSLLTLKASLRHLSSATVWEHSKSVEAGCEAPGASAMSQNPENFGIHRLWHQSMLCCQVCVWGGGGVFWAFGPESLLWGHSHGVNFYKSKMFQTNKNEIIRLKTQISLENWSFFRTL